MVTGSYALIRHKSLKFPQSKISPRRNQERKCRKKNFNHTISLPLTIYLTLFMTFTCCVSFKVYFGNFLFSFLCFLCVNHIVFGLVLKSNIISKFIDITKYLFIIHISSGKSILIIHILLSIFIFGCLNFFFYSVFRLFDLFWFWIVVWRRFEDGLIVWMPGMRVSRRSTSWCELSARILIFVTISRIFSQVTHWTIYERIWRVCFSINFTRTNRTRFQGGHNQRC